MGYLGEKRHFLHVFSLLKDIFTGNFFGVYPSLLPLSTVSVLSSLLIPSHPPPPPGGYLHFLALQRLVTRWQSCLWMSREEDDSDLFLNKSRVCASICGFSKSRERLDFFPAPGRKLNRALKSILYFACVPTFKVNEGAPTYILRTSITTSSVPPLRSEQNISH